jgi:long-chain acyl-CoA synthetase
MHTPASQRDGRIVKTHGDGMSAYESRPWLDAYRADIPGDLDAPPETVLDSFLATARKHPERTFLDDGGTSITYGETAAKASAFAAALLDSGIGRGDRVAVYLQNRPEFAFAQLGIWSAGGVQVPLNPMMRTQELHHLLTDSGTRALVTQDDLWELAGREATGSAGVGSAFVVGDVARGAGVQRWTEVLTAFSRATSPTWCTRPARPGGRRAR